MMLTAVQSNPAPSVFTRVHNPASPPPSAMDTDCEPSTLRHSVQRDKTSTAPSPVGHQGVTPQMIPIAMVPPPHIVIGPGGGYTIVPSLSSTGEGVLGSLSSLHQFGQFTAAGNGKPYVIPAAYYGHPDTQTTSERSTEQSINNRYARLQTHIGLVSSSTADTQPHQSIPSQAASLHHPHPISSLVLEPNHQSSAILQQGTTSPVEVKPSFVRLPVVSGVPSIDSSMLDRGASTSDPEMSKCHHRNSCDMDGEDSLRQMDEEQEGQSENGDPGPDELDSPTTHRERPVQVKEESERTHTSSCMRESSNPTSVANETTPIRASCPVNALVDVPMNPPLTRSSRTSSLSSSLSSFRFGGSLSQLWASQMSLSGKLPNMKSTGNINAETATMPSLGNQYFAFGGSLPELSLTSLTRLLPNSAANDSNISSCPGLFTLLHPPLYVYPSQQHLTTPFINANGSITFGSFLSGGSSLCSAQKSSSSRDAGGGQSSKTVEERDPSTSGGPSADICSSSSITGEENKVSEGSSSIYNKLHGSSSSLSSHDGVKVPLYSPIATPLIGHPHVITALPAFHTITSSAETTGSHSGSHNLPSPVHSTTSQMCHSVNSSPPHVAAPNLNTLACVATAPPHQHLTSPVSPHPPQHHMLHTSTGGSPHTHMQSHPSHHHMQLDTKEGILGVGQVAGSYLTASRPGVIQSAAPLSTCMDINCVKIEGDHSLVQSPVNQGSPRAIPVISMSMSGSDGVPLHPHVHTDMQAHPHLSHTPHNRGLEHSPKKEKDKPYKCDHPGCGRSFSFPAHLRSHVQQIHISYRPCKCDFPSCGKRFYTPQHLNVHRRVHTGERPFVCPYTECAKAFTTAGNLKNHIRIHTGERPYSCKFDGCSKCFAEMSSLKKHELTHTGEKPYKCRVCGKAFSQAGSRNTHERKHSRTEEDGDGDVGGSGKGSRRFRIKRISSSSTVIDNSAVKTEPM